MAEFITFKRWLLKNPDQVAAVVALVRDAIVPHYKKLPGCLKLGLLHIEGTNAYLATQHWVSKAVYEETFASPAYVSWCEEYEPALERWSALMTFEEEWETEDCLGTENAVTASTYLQAALTYIQEHSLQRATIDWPTVLAATWQRAAAAQQPSDTYPAIEFALQQLNDGHSFFRPPAKTQAIQTGAEDSRNRPPTGRLLEPGIAYLYVPDFMGSAAAAMDYARTLQQIIAELDATGPLGWIVDLTDNTGGNAFPMLVGLGPLFDAEAIGAFLDASYGTLVWRYVDGQCIIGPGVCLALDPPVVQLQHRPAPIAVLTGPATSSSGEVVAIAFRGQARTRSFGQPSEGLSTANESFTLSDGAEIMLTIAVCADRTGQRYGAAVRPAVMVEGSPQALRTAACEWLRGVLGA